MDKSTFKEFILRATEEQIQIFFDRLNCGNCDCKDSCEVIYTINEISSSQTPSP
jgi:hypothetical protein